MKTYYANPNYSSSSNDENWVVVGAQSADVATNDLTQLSVGNISAPTSSTTTGYYFAQVEDLSRLTKGWSYLTKTSLGRRNENFSARPYVGVAEPYVYVAEINGFENGDTLAVLEGQQENQDPFSNAATSSDAASSQWSYVRNAGLIPMVSIYPGTICSSFFQTENSSSVASRLFAFTNMDAGDTNYGSTDSNGNPVSATKNYGSVFVPTPDNLGNGNVQAWYLSASGDDTAQANLLTMLPDFTTDGEIVTSVAVGSTNTTVTLGATNTAFKVGQTLTIATNGIAADSMLPYITTGTSVGWYCGKITNVSGAVLTTDLNDSTSNNLTVDPLPASINTGVAFTGTVTTLTTITVTAVSSTANQGIAPGQVLTLTNAISSITSTAATFTVNTTLNHSLYAGQSVTIAGVTGAGFTNYNGDWTVLAVPTGTSFTVNSTINPGSTSAGNVTSATASQQAYIGTVVGNGVGTVITLDPTGGGGGLGLNYQIANGAGIPFSAQRNDYNLRAFAATITNATLQVNIDKQKLNCFYSTAPYYATASLFSLGASLSTTGATTQVVLRGNGTKSYDLASGTVIALVEGDNYQEITLAADVTVPFGGSTAIATVGSFTPNYAYPSRITSVYDPLWNDQLDRYGKVLMLPVVPQIYRNAPVAQFKSMVATTITETISGATYYYGTIGGTYYSNSPYIVSVDDVSNIKVGDTLTFRNDYNPWFSTYDVGAAPGSSGGPWSWTLTDYGAGFTCTSGATFINLPDNNGLSSLPLKKGMSMVTVGATAYVPSGTKVTSWDASHIYLDQNTTGVTAAAVNLRFYPGSSGFNYWKVYSVNSADNTFVIYGSSADYEQVAAGYPSNNDSQNYIFAYNTTVWPGNTIDISSATGQGAGVVGLAGLSSGSAYYNNTSIEGRALRWHTTNTVVGSYEEGGRYIGSQSVGDQEQVIPYRIGSLIGSTLALDIIAQTSTSFATSSLPNTAALGTYDPNFSNGDYDQYGNSPADFVAQNAGFAILSTDDAYSSNYSVGNQFPVVVGEGKTQEVVMAYRASDNGGNYTYPTPVDGGLSLNAPMLWNLAAGQSFQYDHDAGEPVCTPNFIYKTAGTISHAANAPVIGLPNTGTVYG